MLFDNQGATCYWLVLVVVEGRVCQDWGPTLLVIRCSRLRSPDTIDYRNLEKVYIHKTQLHICILVLFYLCKDLRKLYWKAGVDNKPTVFLFTDTQVVDESFLEDINNILSSGEVPNLYGPEDFEEVCKLYTH